MSAAERGGRTLIGGILVAAMALGGGGCAGEDPGAACPDEGCDLQEMRTLSYSRPASLLRTMEVVAPDRDGSWPVVLVAHGGLQRRRAVRDWATGIAARGAMTYNVDWPTKGGLGDQESAARLTCAVLVAMDDAAEQGGDTSRVVFVGHSLGATVGAAVSLGGSAASADCAVADADALPDAFVGYEGPYDISTVDYGEGVPRDPPGDEAADPYAHLGGNPDLVVRLLHGDAEDTAFYDTPMTVSEQFAKALDDAGYDVELIVVQGGEHDPGAIVEGTPAQRAIVDQVTGLLSTL